MPDRKELSAYDAIRPFEPDELPAVYDRLCADQQFRSVVQAVYPGVPFSTLEAKMRTCASGLEFQKAFCYSFIEQLLAKVSTSCDIDTDHLDTRRRYTFVSNHRDIVLDSALLDKLLIDAGFDTTCEIAIGDNLLAASWIKDLVRVNKSFIVERSPGIREMLASSKRLSEYMHLVIAHKHDNVWIAQREGRAKDSDDRTQPSVLKMMAMGGEGSLVERLKQLHIVPLSISYEYDPCDYLKAQEYQLRRDVPGWKKSKADDLLSMKTGIMGYKGAIHYHCAPCIDPWLDTLPTDMPKAQLFDAIAAHIDSEIHRHYRIYPNNRAALDLLRRQDTPEADRAQRFSRWDNSCDDEARQRFELYIEAQIAKVTLPDKDEDYLRRQMLTQYANPLINHLAAQ